MKQIRYLKKDIPEKGDLVKIKTIKEIREEYKDIYIHQYGGGLGDHYVPEESDNPEAYGFGFKKLLDDNFDDLVSFSNSYFSFTKRDESNFSNKKAIVTGVGSSKVFLSINWGKESKLQQFPIEYVRVVQKNYLGDLIKKQKERTKLRTESIDYTGVVEEMISKVDKTKMKRILSTSLKMNAKDVVGIDVLLKEWAEAKKDIYLLFDRQLSITVEREFDLDYNEKLNYFKGFEEKFPVEYWFMKNMFNFEDEIFQNKMCYSQGSSFIRRNFPNIQRGEKFTHVAHEIFHNEKFDIELSEFYNKSKTTGCITISIDPIEYMLMSLNNSGWSSCHTLHKYDGRSGVSYGCYSAGIFSYMCDGTSIIAFRHKNEESEIIINRSKVKAFSKSWRQMVYLDLNSKAFICSRQYPGENLLAEKVVRETLEKILADKFELEHVWKITKNKSAVKPHIIDNLFEDEQNPSDPIKPLHYNDVLNDFGCTFVYNKKLNNSADVLIPIGSYPHCPICGEEVLLSPERPMCFNCADSM